MDSKEVKKFIASTFDDVSSRYDESAFFSLSAQKMVEMLPAEGVKKVLDVSTGTGLVALELARKYPNIQIEAVDLSLGMLNQAQAKAKHEGVENIVFQQGDAECLPYEERIFDIITCGYALFFYPAMEETYQLLCKKVKHGGLFVFSSFTNDAFSPYADMFLNRLEKDHHIEAPQKIRARLKTISQMEALALLSQPQGVEVKRYPIRYSITLDEWWALLNNAGYKGLIDQLSKEDFDVFKQNHLNEIKSVAREGSLELNADTYFGWVTV